MLYKKNSKDKLDLTLFENPTSEYRARYLLFTPYPYGSEKAELKATRNSGTVQPGRSENGRLLACYDVELDSDGFLVSWNVIGESNYETRFSM